MNKDMSAMKAAREEIMELVVKYYNEFLKVDNEGFTEGDRIQYSGRVFDEKEVVNLVDSSLDFWLTAGRYTDEFEKRFAELLGVKYASLVNSGSSANLNAFMALTAPELKERQIKRGDEVITVACGFPTTVAPIMQYGAIPVFVDVTVPEYNIDVTKLEEALSPKTKAVMIAHTLGNPFDLKAVREFCDKHNLWLVEDNCDALGSEYTIDGETRFTGCWGDIGTSSFYPPHHITMGEGGCVYTNNALLHKLVRSYRDWGRDCVCPPGKDNFCGRRFDGTFGQLPQGYDHKYVYSHLGYNLKATDMQAAVGCAQLDKLIGFADARRKNWDRLYKNLEDLSDVLILPKASDNSKPSWFGFIMSVREDAKKANGEAITRNSITKALEENNIQTRLLFSGNIIKHPCFDEFRGTDAYRVVGGLDTTDFIMNNAFWIGVYPGMNDEKIDFMASVIRKACGR
ncbi:lipopolysaccharide biosynthesis protein RfbH [Butyrivibrio proteoclasticus]|uniref:lipopolysaccharide biosynthesis protein RfbH n=1 Tax=Butyrivibrio proteoclasticus TaxID=43305 RepID=UPI00047E80FB|nr:lipopolysaccharide biosynthesis protein RfbH [Butyrivibrio proteoclasticus]